MLWTIISQTRKICDIMIKAHRRWQLAGFYESHFLEQRLVFLFTKTPPSLPHYRGTTSGHKERGKIKLHYLELEKWRQLELLQFLITKHQRRGHYFVVHLSTRHLFLGLETRPMKELHCHWVQRYAFSYLYLPQSICWQLRTLSIHPPP